MMRHGFRGRTVLAALAVLVGCDSEDKPADSRDTSDASDATAPDTHSWNFELAGEWTSPFGGTEVITDTRWDTFDTEGALVFGQFVASFSNVENYAVVQNPPDAEFGANTFGRIVWLEPTTEGFAYCTVAYGLESAEDAAAAPELGVDREDLEAGCGGFAWTTLTR